MASTSTGIDKSDPLRRRNVPVLQVNDSNVAIPFGDQEEGAYEKSPTSHQDNGFLAKLHKYELLIAPAIFTFLAFFTRFYRIGRADKVIWDEAHFGKFASYYLKREFYFDVHPPLGKMLNGLAGYAAGYNGSFPFKSGEQYPPELNYTAMRVFNASFGALCVPLAYFTARALNLRRLSVWLVTLMVLFENSTTTISRFILLDSMLIFFTVSTVFCWAHFHSVRHEPFSEQWIAWLLLTGINIGCVCSIKWVGLFCTALVGIYTIEDLWGKLGDIRMPKTMLASHFAARVFGLIIIPICVYMLSFYIHFVILENSGPGDAQMSSLFQANLRGSNVGKNSPLEVAFGSEVTLKNMGMGGGLLHSHIQTFPEGSKQQQVTCYHHKDSNNDWIITPNRSDRAVVPEEEPRFIRDGSEIRFLHAQTGRNLHSHFIEAPVTKKDLEVSCYGNATVGDAKDHWVVEVVDDTNRDRSRIRTLTTALRLRNPVLGCYLRAGRVHLPPWGFKQIEVTCTRENSPKDIYTHWNVETHRNSKLPPGEASFYKSPFLKDFVHVNVAMWNSNNALVPDPDKDDQLASSYWQWPFLSIGMRMCGWDDKAMKYYLLGNPLIYWLSAASLVVFAGMVAWYLVRWQRGYTELSERDIDHIHFSGLYPLIGWILHFMPFIAMGRVTYFHHYFPALYFAIILLGFCVDWMTRKLSCRTQAIVYGALYVAIVGCFIHFRAVTFGMEGPNSQYAHLDWLKNWRIHDRPAEF